jgi:MIP family channel proteins
VALPQRLAAEALGTALLVFFGPGSAVVSAYNDGAITLEGIAAANGLVILVLIYALGHVSGAHFNPGVTLSFVLTRNFRLQDAAPYAAAQVAGAIAGATLLWALFGDALAAGVTQPSGSDGQAFAMEFVLTFALMFVIMAVATDVRAAGQAAAIAIGTVVGIDVLLGGTISGGSMNPARSVGPALVSGELSGLWIYLIAPPLGAMAGAFTYELIRGDRPWRSG